MFVFSKRFNRFTLFIFHSESFVRAMVVTSWRSGSTLTGELLNSLPGSFYSYEPLSLFGIDRIYNGSKHVQSAINVIKGIFECDYTIVHKECKFKEKPEIEVILCTYHFFNYIFILLDGRGECDPHGIRLLHRRYRSNWNFAENPKSLRSKRRWIDFNTGCSSLCVFLAKC